MSVSIHYRGRLHDVGQLAKLCEELADIAATMGWESTQLDDDWEQPVDTRLLKKRMDFIAGKIDQLAGDLSGGRWNDMSGLSAEQIALRIEQWFLENGHADAN